jgi:predicted small metal-binding protein
MTCKQCGASLTADDDEALVAAAQEHFVETHKFLPVSEHKIRETVLASATDA